MARFSSFLGRRVEVQYRASDTLLPASGVFVADSGRSIFLEQSFEQRGQHRHFRWEIPYQHLVRIGLLKPDEHEIVPANNGAHCEPARSEAKGERKDKRPSASATASPNLEPMLTEDPRQSLPEAKRASSAAAGAGLVSGVLPMGNRSKTA